MVWKKEIARHFAKHWFAWVTSFTGFCAVFFLVTFNRDVGKIEGKVERMEKQTDEAAAKYDKLADKIHQLEIDLARKQK